MVARTSEREPARSCTSVRCGTLLAQRRRMSCPGRSARRLCAWSLCALACAVGSLALSGCYRTHMRREFTDGGTEARDAPVGDAGITMAVTVACGEASRPPSAEGVAPCEVDGRG
jgi:hypothetical protein